MKDVHDRVFDALQARMTTLESGAPAAAPGEAAWTQEEIDAALAELEGDKALLLDHWKVQSRTSAHPSPVLAKACGRPQPCPHVLGLAQKYGCI